MSIYDNRKRPHKSSDDDLPTAKKSSDERHIRAMKDDDSSHGDILEPIYSKAALRMMDLMGYKSGKGLGKSESGIINPIEASQCKRRRGLGLRLKKFEKFNVLWKDEDVECDQKVKWLDECTLPTLTESDLQDWMSTGERKSTIADETEFCDPAILEKILSSKSVFDELATREIVNAHRRSNPFESIGKAIFQNRAAMKMANIDAVCDYMFTSPKRSGKPLGPNDVLYFTDICFGPGAFTEYVLWRKKWHAKGFGITLKNPDSGFEFKLNQFLAGTCETFDPHYGVNGYDGDGDITKPNNIVAFQEYILSQTNREGVDFVMADGGISVVGWENIQEILHKQLVLCQYLCALMILKTGGHFVCAVFDQFTPFSVGLFYLLYRCFEQVSIFKPVTSRPANSERFIICKCLREDTEHIYQYLFKVNTEMCRLKDQKKNDILQVVPFHLLTEEPFFTYVKESNDIIGRNQIIALKKLLHYVQNPFLSDDRQADIRVKCLKLWNVPLESRGSFVSSLSHVPTFEDDDDDNGCEAMEVFHKIWAEVDQDHYLNETVLCTSSFKEVTASDPVFVKAPYSWKWCWTCGKRCVLVGLGMNKVQVWDMSSENNTPIFKTVSGIDLDLPKGTVLEVELVQELTGEGLAQLGQCVMYIADVLAVYDEVFVNKSFKTRISVAQKLCKVLNKPCRTDKTLLKVKQYYHLEEMEAQINGLVPKVCKPHVDVTPVQQVVPTIDVTEDKFITPRGVIFCKTVKDPWDLHFSTENGKLYFYNDITKESSFEATQSSVASFKSVVQSRHIWRWSNNKEFTEDLYGNTDDDTPPEPHMLLWSQLRTVLSKSCNTK